MAPPADPGPGPRRTRPARGARLARTPRPADIVTDTELAPGPAPVRTCVGCRARCRDVELLRVVAAAGTVVPDPLRRLPGRGAWLHPDLGCFDLASKRRAFARALRLRADIDATPVRRYLSERLGPERSASPEVATPEERGNEVDPS